MHIIDIINEGLVKYPPRMEEECFKHAIGNLLWMIRDKCGEEYPDHRDAVEDESDHLGITLPSTPFVMHPQKVFLFRVKFDFDGLGPTYAHLTHDYSECILFANYGGANGKCKASCREKLIKGQKIIIVSIDFANDKMIEDFPSNEPPFSVETIVEDVRESIRHELRHVVQLVLLKQKDARQIERKSDYASIGSGYHTSRIERDPLIGTEVARFMTHYEEHAPNDLSGFIKHYVGIDTAGNYPTSHFFKTLKENDKAAYKIAVKKFFVEVSELLKAYDKD